MKLLLVGGGTGGHILPFVSLVNEAQKQGLKIELVLADATLDRAIYEENFSVPAYFLRTDKIRRYLDIKNFLAPFKILKAVFQAQTILKKSKPNAIFFKGGFVCFPLLIATIWHNIWQKKKIKIYSHESDISVGVLSKLYAKYADFVFESFGKKTSFPLFFSAQSQPFSWQTKQKKLLVFGGSQGAQFLNEFVQRNQKILTDYFEICLVTGRGKSIQSKHKNIHQFELLPAEKLKGALETADVVLSRAGANSLFEILSNQKKSVIVPLPSAARNHQFLNAQYFAQKGLIELYEQADTRNLTDLLVNTTQNKSLEEMLKTANIANAAPQIIKIILKSISAR
ncbi:hypothetical protein CSB37_03005 [bacterium DOLZORAL124_38_8]|nr:MAG: hypothetical protein CSB37_03005 [bacterium DOLZORAL124_38_8]